MWGFGHGGIVSFIDRYLIEILYKGYGTVTHLIFIMFDKNG